MSTPSQMVPEVSLVLSSRAENARGVVELGAPEPCGEGFRQISRLRRS